MKIKPDGGSYLTVLVLTCEALYDIAALPCRFISFVFQQKKIADKILKLIQAQK